MTSIMSVRKLDRKNGEVYEEQAMAPALSFSMGPSWVHESPFLPPGLDARSESGSPSLRHSAMKQLLSDQRNLTAQLFIDIPWCIASHLWDYLGRNKRRTLYMWKVFAAAYPNQFRDVARYRSVKIKEPQMPLQDYLSLVKSESLSWRLALTLTSSFARVPELVGISSIKNLVALEIATPRDAMSSAGHLGSRVVSLSDRIVRTWCELAESSGAFAHLRVLRLYHQHDLSLVALRYLSALPCLCLIVAHDCSNLIFGLAEDDLRERGWGIAPPRFAADGVAHRDTTEPQTLYECYQESFSADIEEHQTRQGTLDRNSPILDFRIGHETNAGLERGHNAGIAQPRSTILLQRRKTSESRPSEPGSKRLKLAAESLQGTSQPRPGPRKPKLKERNPRDLRDALGDFL